MSDCVKCRIPAGETALSTPVPANWLWLLLIAGGVVAVYYVAKKS